MGKEAGPKEIFKYLSDAQAEFDKLTKDLKPMQQMAEAVLRQPKVKRIKRVNIESIHIEIALLDDNSIKIVTDNREQADSLFNEIHLYKKPTTLLNACIRYFKNLLR